MTSGAASADVPQLYEAEIRCCCSYRQLELTEIFSDIE